MPTSSNSTRTIAAALAGLGLLLLVILALMDWALAALLLGAMLVGAAVAALARPAAGLYREHRSGVWIAAGVVVVALLVLLRPDGRADEAERAPVRVARYDAEVWPLRAAAEPTFIVRESFQPLDGGDARGARSTIEALATGPFMRELRFVPGASAGAGALTLGDDGAARFVVNPWDGGEFYQARRGKVGRIRLPSGDVVQVDARRLPAEVRVAWLVGAGTTLRPLLGAAAPLRRLPLALAILLFGGVGAFAGAAWGDRLKPPRLRPRSRAGAAPVLGVPSPPPTGR